jgi:hypothetical protein
MYWGLDRGTAAGRADGNTREGAWNGYGQQAHEYKRAIFHEIGLRMFIIYSNLRAAMNPNARSGRVGEHMEVAKVWRLA